eukprot:scaffold5901_cov116-Cylindrotheca_fusiformis.AAC.12
MGCETQRWGLSKLRKIWNVALLTCSLTAVILVCRTLYASAVSQSQFLDVVDVALLVKSASSLAPPHSSQTSSNQSRLHCLYSVGAFTALGRWRANQEWLPPLQNR